MKKIDIKKKSKTGLAPGTAVFTGVRKMDNIEIFVTQYDDNQCNDYSPKSIGALIKLLETINANFGSKLTLARVGNHHRNLSS